MNAKNVLKKFAVMTLVTELSVAGAVLTSAVEPAKRNAVLELHTGESVQSIYITIQFAFLKERMEEPVTEAETEKTEHITENTPRVKVEAVIRPAKETVIEKETELETETATEKESEAANEDGKEETELETVDEGDMQEKSEGKKTVSRIIGGALILLVLAEAIQYGMGAFRALLDRALQLL